jgi:hypothetical protein
VKGLGWGWGYHQGGKIRHVRPPEPQPPVAVDKRQGLKQGREGNALLAGLAVKLDEQHFVVVLREVLLLLLLLLCQHTF